MDKDQLQKLFNKIESELIKAEKFNERKGDGNFTEGMKKHFYSKADGLADAQEILLKIKQEIIK